MGLRELAARACDLQGATRKMILLLVSAAVALTGPCTITDGDTIRCGWERIRLLGIDAPEAHGCPAWRRCAKGDPAASTESLRRLVTGRSLSIARDGVDRYGRTLAVVYAAGRNLSCAQLAARAAVYVAKWDEREMVKRDCPIDAR